MRALLLALPFTLLPLSGQAGQHDHGHRHAAPHAPAESAASLGSHAHGIGELFRRFPATERLQVQLIGPRGQQGSELGPARSRLTL